MEIVNFLFHDNIGWGITVVILLTVVLTPVITVLNNLADTLRVRNAERMAKSRREAAAVYAANADKLTKLHAAQCVLLEKLTEYRKVGGTHDILIPTKADLQALYDASPDAPTEDES